MKEKKVLYNQDNAIVDELDYELLPYPSYSLEAQPITISILGGEWFGSNYEFIS